MMTGDRSARLVRKVWRRRSWRARAARAVLLPFSGLYAGVVAVRAAAYRAGVARARPLPLPAIAVGNLSVGGTGKTPLAAWIAAYCVRAGRRPGILLRGYGRDEVLVHERLVPEAIVVANRDRQAGGAAAQSRGADVLVLDDAFQLLAVRPDLNIVVLAAEQERLARWTLPAGPWREPREALGRADILVVTRKRAEAESADALAGRLAARWRAATVAQARLVVRSLVGMRTGARVSLDGLRGRQVHAAAAIADPESFAVQIRASGATVQLAAYQDHHEYDAADVRRLMRLAATAGYLVVTEKDAVKLRALWPAEGPEPFVAELEWMWERNEGAVVAALNRVLAVPGHPKREITDRNP
jgi:tetraacyldisaccharide 4'-kinase